MTESSCTAILICHNDRQSVGTALASIWSQTLEDLDIIVVDDGSTDGSRAVIEEAVRSVARTHPERAAHTTVLTQENAGPSSARNAGIAAAQSRFVAFLDADDEWLPGKCRHQIGLMNETGCALLGGNFYYRKHQSIVPVNLTTRPLKRICFAQTLFKYYFTPSCVMAQTTVIREVGGFPEGQHFVEDAYAFSACARIAPAMISCEYYAIRQLHGPDEPNLSSKTEEMNRWEAANIRRLRYENGLTGMKRSPLLFYLASALLPLRRWRRMMRRTRFVRNTLKV
jgi:hypothetical protein